MRQLHRRPKAVDCAFPFTSKLVPLYNVALLSIR